MPDEAAVREVLKTVKYPGFSRDIISFGLVKSIDVDGSKVRVLISFATADPNIPEQIYAEAKQKLESLPGVSEVALEMDLKQPPRQAPTGAALQEMPQIEGVKWIVAVASGKGGVGKSTVAANLAVSLERTGCRVGLCDCDLYGPSIPLMFGTDEQPMANDREQIIPIRAHGLQLMSIGFLAGDDTPVIVRGPLATRYVQDFLRRVAWDHLDYLVLDLPPGTGDIQLTIVQTVALAGAIIVTTPQEVALIDARKAAAMFGRVNVPILGLVENMSYFLCPSDGKRYDIFGTCGGQTEAKRLGVPFLGEVPIDIETRKSGDEGRPIALRKPTESAVSAAFEQIARTLRKQVEATKA